MSRSQALRVSLSYVGGEMLDLATPLPLAMLARDLCRVRCVSTIDDDTFCMWQGTAKIATWPKSPGAKLARLTGQIPEQDAQHDYLRCCTRVQAACEWTLPHKSQSTGACI